MNVLFRPPCHAIVWTTLTPVLDISPAGAIVAYASEVYISGSAMFTHNSAGENGGENVLVAAMLFYAPLLH